ncbi:MAG: hypothetical protein LIO42_02000, partial [Oscillospiraceae bacterium]|nr:hypothetical protein [Oscillospiraceae bacterium]
MARRSEGQGLRSMLAVDLRRMFTTPLFYILLGLSAAIPVLILVMTTMMAGTVTVDPNTGVESVAEGFDSVWQIIGSLSGSSAAGEMDMTSMCNINLVYFLAAVLVCVFMADDFRSGFAKGLFSLRPGKGGYAASKTAVCALCGMLLLAAFFLGAMAGGRMAGLSFAPLA